jgi:hypothetical protein
MTAMAIFMGLCMLGMLVLLRFLFAWFKESTVSGSYLVKIGEQQKYPSELYSTAALATGRASTRLA